MIRIVLTLATFGSPFLIFHFLSTGQFWEAAKAIVASVAILALLVLCMTVRRAGWEAGY